MFSLSLALPMLFTMLIHAADSLSYALRLGGLRTRRIALAISLAGILFARFPHFQYGTGPDDREFGKCGDPRKQPALCKDSSIG